jgi:anti-sigma factor RsiW
VRRHPREQEAVLETRPYITCQQLIDFIGSYLENELPGDQRGEFERHLAVCPSCQAYLKTYQQTVLLTKAAVGDEVPEDVPDALVRAVLSARLRAPSASED